MSLQEERRPANHNPRKGASPAPAPRKEVCGPDPRCRIYNIWQAYRRDAWMSKFDWMYDRRG